MRNRCIWLVLVAIFLGGGFALTAILEPTHVIRGLLFGEPFYRDRPLSYWREVLVKQGRDKQVSEATARQFYGDDSLPILRECAHDPDRNVRWPAIYLLGRTGLRTQKVMKMLLKALEDEDAEVRIKAVSVLAGWGPQARPAIMALTARLTDVEFQIAHYADLALWEIDESAAVEACSWRTFTSPEFDFSVTMPTQLEFANAPYKNGFAATHTFQSWHWVGFNNSPTRYIVIVAEYPKDIVDKTTEDERFARLKENAPAFFSDGKILQDKEVYQNDRRGREYLIEVTGKGCIQSRGFWVGRKLYVVQAIYSPNFLNKKAVDYYFNSFKIDEKGKGSNKVF